MENGLIWTQAFILKEQSAAGLEVPLPLVLVAFAPLIYTPEALVKQDGGPL